MTDGSHSPAPPAPPALFPAFLRLTGKRVLVVGAGPVAASKLKAIEAKNIPTLNEDEFLELIRVSEGEMDEKAIKAQEKEEEKIKQQAREMEAKEKEEEKLRKRKEAALEGTGVAVK